MVILGRVLEGLAAVGALVLGGHAAEGAGAALLLRERPPSCGEGGAASLGDKGGVGRSCGKGGAAALGGDSGVAVGAYALTTANDEPGRAMVRWRANGIVLCTAKTTRKLFSFRIQTILIHDRARATNASVLLPSASSQG